jgi:hypothetical protein
MTEKIIVVDDLYDIPHQYHKGFFENQCLITDEIIGKISHIIGNKIEIIQASNEVLSKEQNTSVCCHLSSDWIAVIYLTLPMVSFGESGIKFYSHINSGLESFPSPEYLQKHNISESDLLNIFDSDLKLWKEYGNIPTKYNRMVLFRSNLWHSYGEGFGEDLNTSMLYQKIIIRNV